MSTPKTPKQRQTKRRDSLKTAGITRITLSLDNATAKILRSLAVEHKVTQPEVLKMGMLLTRNALMAAEEHLDTLSTSLTPAIALDAQGNELPPMRASVARAVRLGLAVEAYP